MQSSDLKRAKPFKNGRYKLPHIFQIHQIKKKKWRDINRHVSFKMFFFFDNIKIDRTFAWLNFWGHKWEVNVTALLIRIETKSLIIGGPK